MTATQEMPVTQEMEAPAPEPDLWEDSGVGAVIGCQVMAGHPDWAYLADPYPSDSLPAFMGDLLDAADMFIYDNRRAIHVERSFLTSWNNAAYEIALERDPGRYAMLSQQMPTWTDKYLPAASTEAELPAAEAEPQAQEAEPQAEEAAEPGDPDPADADAA